MGVAVTQLPGGEIVPAMERGVIDAFEFNNPSSDRRSAPRTSPRTTCWAATIRPTSTSRSSSTRTSLRLAGRRASGDPEICQPRRPRRPPCGRRSTTTRSDLVKLQDGARGQASGGRHSRPACPARGLGRGPARALLGRPVLRAGDGIQKDWVDRVVFYEHLQQPPTSKPGLRALLRAAGHLRGASERRERAASEPRTGAAPARRPWSHVASDVGEGGRGRVRPLRRQAEPWVGHCFSWCIMILIFGDQLRGFRALRAGSADGLGLRRFAT